MQTNSVMSTQRRGRTRVVLIQLRGKAFSVAQPLLGVGVAKRLDQLGVHPRLVLVGQVISEVAPFVQPTSLDRRLGAEHLVHRRRQRLGTVDDTSSPSSNLRPRSTRSASRARTTVLFSVEPSHSPTGFWCRRR